MQRISLIMFKNYLNILPTPLSELFIVNNTRYEYFTRQPNDVHVDIGLKEGVYKLFTFHGIHIWNHISKKIHICIHMLASRIYPKIIYKIIAFHTYLFY